MNQDYPVPPPELVKQWLGEQYGVATAPSEATIHVATQAARWGADQELDACCADILQILAGIYEDKVEDWNRFVELLRDGRRPTVNEQALDALLEEQGNFGNIANFQLIKGVLEKLIDD